MRRATWAGQVPQVQAALREQWERLGPPPARAKADDPSKVVSLVLAYVTNNAARMDYPRYRREGLPVTSTMVEAAKVLPNTCWFNQRGYWHMLTKYLEAAMRRAHYEILTDGGTYYGEIPECQGVYVNARTLEACRSELAEVIEDWLLFRVYKNLPLPKIDGNSFPEQAKRLPTSQNRSA
jgi:predicted RNase H-like HicB family nuclease